MDPAEGERPAPPASDRDGDRPSEEPPRQPPTSISKKEKRRASEKQIIALQRAREQKKLLGEKRISQKKEAAVMKITEGSYEVKFDDADPKREEPPPRPGSIQSLFFF